MPVLSDFVTSREKNTVEILTSRARNMAFDDESLAPAAFVPPLDAIALVESCNEEVIWKYSSFSSYHKEFARSTVSNACSQYMFSMSTPISFLLFIGSTIILFKY